MPLCKEDSISESVMGEGCEQEAGGAKEMPVFCPPALLSQQPVVYC